MLPEKRPSGAPAYQSAAHHRVHLPAEVVQPLQILLKGFAAHAVDGNPEERHSFQTSLTDAADSFDEGSSSEDLSLAVDRVVRAVDRYHSGVNGTLGAHLAELRAMLCSLTETLIFLSGFSDSSVKHLGTLETRLQQMTTHPDAQQVRRYMEECLALVRNEGKRVQHETRAKIHSLQEEIERLTHRLKEAAEDSNGDLVTGLPGSQAAESAIEERTCNGEEVVTALFVIDRMASINARFGRTIGDAIMLAVAQTIAQKLTGVTLYRWTGPALLAVFEPGIHPSVCEGRARCAASLRVEENLEIGERSVLIVVTCSLHLQRVSQRLPPEAAFKSIETFLAAHGATLSAA